MDDVFTRLCPAHFAMACSLVIAFAEDRRMHPFRSTVFFVVRVLLRKRLMSRPVRCSMIWCSQGEECIRKDDIRWLIKGCWCGRQDLEAEASALLEQIRKGGHWGGAAASWGPLRRMCSRPPNPFFPLARPPARSPTQLALARSRKLCRCNGAYLKPVSHGLLAGCPSDLRPDIAACLSFI